MQYTMYAVAAAVLLKNSFIFGGSADGNGLMKYSDGTFTILLNNEDNFAVSRIKLDATFKPISGEYVLNSMFPTRRCLPTACISAKPTSKRSCHSSEHSQLRASAKSQYTTARPARNPIAIKNRRRLRYPGARAVQCGQKSASWMTSFPHHTHLTYLYARLFAPPLLR